MTARSAGSASHPDEPRRSRICSHIESGRSFGIVCAHRGDLPAAENTMRLGALKERVRGAGHGFIEIRCAKHATQEVVSEGLLFVPGVQRASIASFGEACEQHAVLFKDDAELSLVGTSASSGVGKVLMSYAHGEQGDVGSAMEAIRHFCTGLLQSSRAGEGLVFDVQEREPWSFNQAAYSNRGEKPGWITVSSGSEAKR